MNNSISPIALFAYNRPDHLKQTLESLIQNQGFEQSQLFVYSDGPGQTGDTASVEAVRELVRSYDLPNCRLIESLSNLGLKTSITQGVSDLCEKYGRVIVLEDDLVTSPWFLQYMNKALDRYADNKSVYQISGYMYPTAQIQTESDTLFLPFTSTWGWATWKSAWDKYDPDMSGYSEVIKNWKTRYQFNINGSFPWITVLQRIRRHTSDTWGALWYLSVFLEKGLVLYPKKSLVKNIGFDASGTHSRRIKMNIPSGYALDTATPVKVENIPLLIHDNDYRAASKAIRHDYGWLMSLLAHL